MSDAALPTRRLDATRDADVAEAVRLLRAGRLVAVPTETVYGLAADATNPDAVRGIFTAKGRPSNHPLIVHLGDPAWLDAWAREVPETARRLAAAFWRPARRTAPGGVPGRPVPRPRRTAEDAA